MHGQSKVKRLTPRRIPELPEGLVFVGAVRQRHPSRRSICGVLLAEVSSSQSEIGERSQAALLLFLRGCRRGLKVLDRVAWEAHAAIMSGLHADDEFPVGKQRYLLSAVLFAIARTDSFSSHAALVGYLDSFKNVHLRSDVLEAMAFEEEMFDLELVMGFLVEDAEEALLLSALYAMEHKATSVEEVEEVRQRVTAFLGHPSAMVRTYAVRVLMFDPESAGMLSALAEDPDPYVREAVAEAEYWRQRR